MKEVYHIKEIADLFDLCPDTLRYYEEKGLIHPFRGENRYRMYGIQDICTLNVIRSLRELGMPVERIRDYLTGRSLAGSLTMLEEEEGILLRRMEELEQMRREVLGRRRRLERYGQMEVGEIQLCRRAERPFVSLRRDIILEDEIDFLLKKLENIHQDYIKILGSQCMGAVLDETSLAAGLYNHYDRVFFLTESGLPHDGALPAGQYARIFYRGPYKGFQRNYQALERQIRDWGLHPEGPPLELYRIDVHDTEQEDEYVTEIQIRVSEPWDSRIPEQLQQEVPGK